jgi:hypothetical protein
LLDKKFEAILKELGKNTPPPAILEQKIKDIFHRIRIKGNRAIHELLGDEGTALSLLKEARNLAIWYQKGYRTEIKKAFGIFTTPAKNIESDEYFENQLKLLKDKLINTEEKAKILTEEANAAMELAEEFEGKYLRYSEGINNIINSNNFDLNKAMDLASKAANDIKENANELSKIIDIKYYAIGFKIGQQKQKKLSVSDIKNIQHIKNKYGESDPAEGLADELFSEYNKEWTDTFVKANSGYVLKGLIIDETTKDLFDNQDRCAETFYQYMIGFATGLIGK